MSGVREFVLGTPLEQRLAQGRDNFLLLRLLAASLVMFGHSWGLANNPSGANDWISQHTGVFAGTIAVNVFFWISGLLITMSYARRQAPIEFAIARIARIFPGLVVNVLFCALVIGAVATTLPLRDYFTDPQWPRFVTGNALLNDLQWLLPGVFADNRYPAVVNGALWTLPGELRMYEIVLVLGLLRVLRGRAWRLDAALLLLAGVALWVPSIELLQQAEFVEFGAFFAMGAACWNHRRNVPVSTSILLALALIAFALRGHSAYRIAFSLAVAYGAMWFAYVPRLPSLERFGDYSYGVYLYGFPCQQLVAWRFPAWGPWTLLCVAMPMALALAVLSWHGVEKPALSVKRLLSRRRTDSAVAPVVSG